jgi:hypothetical protein
MFEKFGEIIRRRKKSLAWVLRRCNRKWRPHSFAAMSKLLKRGPSLSLRGELGEVSERDIKSNIVFTGKRFLIEYKCSILNALVNEIQELSHVVEPIHMRLKEIEPHSEDMIYLVFEDMLYALAHMPVKRRNQEAAHPKTIPFEVEVKSECEKTVSHRKELLTRLIAQEGLLIRDEISHGITEGEPTDVLRYYASLWWGISPEKLLELAEKVESIGMKLQRVSGYRGEVALEFEDVEYVPIRVLVRRGGGAEG